MLGSVERKGMRMHYKYEKVLIPKNPIDSCYQIILQSIWMVPYFLSQWERLHRANPLAFKLARFSCIQLCPPQRKI